MISQNKISFKDIIQKNNNLPIILNEKRYTYEEYKNIIKEQEFKKKPINKKQKLIMDFLDENLSNICDSLNELKDKYSIDGFLNNVEYKNIFDIIIPNIIVDEIINDNEENDQFFDDDDNYFKE
jgi:hypothetical protein